MNRLGLCVHGLGPKHGVVCWCGCCCGGGGGGVGVGANSIPKIWHTQDLVTYACNMSWRWHTPDIETTLLLGREIRVDGRRGRGRQGTSALPQLHAAPIRVVYRVAFVHRKGAFFLHLVFCPPEVGLTQASLAGALWVLASGLMACGPWALASGFWLEGSLAYGFYAHGLWALVCDLCLRDLFSVRPGDDVVFRPSPQDTLTTQKVREIHLQPKYADAFWIVPDLSDTKRTRRC